MSGMENTQPPPTSPTHKLVPLSGQIFLLPAAENESESSSRQQEGPDVVLIFGWGDGQLKHVARYADGFRTLFPRAKIIFALSQIFRALTQSQAQRVVSMRPLIEEAFGPGRENTTQLQRQPSVLVHVLSNTGGLYFAATLEAYKRDFGRQMPHSLLVMDSTPGSMDHDSSNIGRLADAMAMDAKTKVPWPPQVTKALFIMALYAMRGIELARGRENPVVLSINMANDGDFATKSARRLYIYSKEDALTAWEAVERHAAEATERGYVVECARFEGSGHVQHMRRWPERYWGSIRRAWTEGNNGLPALRAKL